MVLQTARKLANAPGKGGGHGVLVHAGAGGAPDFIAYAKETILTLKGGEFVDKLDYFTSPGYLGGGTERDDSGLFPPGSGPSMLISTEGIFRFEKESKELYLESVLPGMTVEDVKKKVPWELKTLEPLKPYPRPTAEELEYVRRFAPHHCMPRATMMELGIKLFFEFAGGRNQPASGG